MARNQLPEGVGKKIVEALKKQAEADITPVLPADSTLNADASGSETSNFADVNFDDFKDAPASQGAAGADASASSFDIKYKNDDAFAMPEKETFNMSFDMSAAKKDDIFAPNAKDAFPNMPVYNMQNKKDDFFPQPQQDAYSNQTFNLQTKKDSDAPLYKAGNDLASQLSYGSQPQGAASGVISSYSGIPFNEEQKIPPAAPTVTISIPTNVAVLKNLISSLPVGVTKQTGAQIIRQTLEAMGLPMASVLKEAQEVQEELNTNTRECMLKIQEYKTNIMQLEQSVQEYQKNMSQINDLVSLFLLTDRKS